jgi:hypothetical protein
MTTKNRNCADVVVEFRFCLFFSRLLTEEHQFQLTPSGTTTLVHEVFGRNVRALCKSLMRSAPNASDIPTATPTPLRNYNDFEQHQREHGL